MERDHVRLGLVAGSDCLESYPVMKTLLRFLLVCALLAVNSANAVISVSGITTDTYAHVCSALSNSSYWYSNYAYGWWSPPSTVVCRVDNAAGYQGTNSFTGSGTETPGECGPGKVLDLKYKCVDPVECTYPQVRDAATNTCKPELDCPAGKKLKIIGINPNWSGCYPDTPPVPDGTLGNPPKPDGRCAPGLVNQGGVCVYNSGGTGGTGPGGAGKGGPGQPPIPDPITGENNCTPPNVIFPATGLCQPPPASCTSPNVVNPYTGACVPPLGPDEHFDPDTGDPVSGGGDPPPGETCTPPAIPDPVNPGICVTNDCAETEGAHIDSGFQGTIREFTPTGPAMVERLWDMVSCVDGCRYHLNGVTVAAGDFALKVDPDNRVVGGPLYIYADFIGEGAACLSGDKNAPSSGGQVAPGVGCPEGQHNNNDSPASCVADGLSCPVGQHVVQFGISETGGVMETCVADTSDTGTDGVPPSPDGTCAAGLVNVNGICTNLIGTGGTPGVPGGTQGTSSQSGQCGAPGFPPCSTDIGGLFGTMGTGTDPTARTSGEVGSALGVGNFPVLNSIKGWTLPAHSSSCDFGSFAFNDKTYTLQPVCDQFTAYKPQMSIAFLFLWSVLPFFMVLRS